MMPTKEIEFFLKHGDVDKNKNPGVPRGKIQNPEGSEDLKIVNPGVLKVEISRGTPGLGSSKNSLQSLVITVHFVIIGSPVMKRESQMLLAFKVQKWGQLASLYDSYF